MKNLLSMFCLAIAASAFAQDGTLDTTFNVGTGFSGGTVLTTVVQSDNKIIAGGNFTDFNGAVKNRIVRLNTNGTLDTTFNIGTGFNNVVWSSAIQSDGKIIVGGDFSQFNGTITNRIARLNVNGTLDIGFNLGTQFNNSIRALKIQSDGKIIVGGAFTDFNGTTRNRIARLNTDGTLDTIFNSAGAGFDATIRSIAIQTDGKIIVGGDFINFNGAIANHIARLNTDGTLDTNFISGTMFNDVVWALEVLSNGKIVAGGSFTDFNGTIRNRIARLNTNGTLDITLNSGTGFNNSIWALKIQSDGKIITAGQFEFNGTGNTGNYIARLNIDGTFDTSFDAGTGFNDWVYATTIQADGKIIAVGRFTEFNGVSRSGIARLNATTIVGVSENTPNAAATFDVYPNPTNAMVSVSLPDALLGQKISLLNTIGQVLETKNITTTTMSYDLANLANGIYFIQVQTNKGIVTKKVVKH